MSDSQDGSSAARRALPDPDDPPGRGFFGRIMGAWGGAETGTASSETADGPSVVESLPGLAGLHRLRVEDVAIPEAEIVAVSQDIDRQALVQLFRDSGFSRLPVYGETLDQPLGLLLLKDLALEYGFNGGNRPIDLKPLLRPLLYVPPSMPLVVLLQKMQTSRIHMALVIDEYGGVVGLVTIEDLIEQVVGEIEDEHDNEEDETWWVSEGEGRWLVQARTPLEEFEAEIARSLTESIDHDEIDTLGGLVILLAGRVPVRGEVILHSDGVEFEVVEADPRRVKRLRVRLGGRSASEDGAGASAEPSLAAEAVSARPGSTGAVVTPPLRAVTGGVAPDHAAPDPGRADHGRADHGRAGPVGTGGSGGRALTGGSGADSEPDTARDATAQTRQRPESGPESVPEPAPEPAPEPVAMTAARRRGERR